MSLRIGFAGCGFIAQIHAFALGELIKAGLVDATIVAAFDLESSRADRLAASYGARRASDLDDLLDAVDVVWVCTWTASHLSVVRAAVERRLAVYCEKPLAPTIAECEEIAGLLANVPHQVGLVLRHAPVFQAAAAAVVSGDHGRPLAAVFRDDQFFPIQGMYASEWRADVDKAGGGTLLEHSIHDVDVLRWILGEPVSVSARVASRFGHHGIDDVADVTLDFADGGVATLVSVWHRILRRPSTRRLEIFCEDALLWADDDNLGPLHVETGDDQHDVAGVVPPWAARLELPTQLAHPILQYATPAKAFLDALAAGVPPSPGAEVALAAHRIVEAAYRSAGSGNVPVGIARRPLPPAPPR
jgi:predicted dehydrogenase